MLYTSDNAPELGVGMICGDGTATSISRSSLDQTCFDGDFHVFAGRYHTGDGIVRIYQDGYPKNGESASDTGSNTGSALTLEVGGNSTTASLASTSAIAWVAVFDVALTEGEIRGWSSGAWKMFEPANSAMIVVPDPAPNSRSRVIASGRYRR